MNNNDGGYYAIKGYIYQFDKTLIDVLENPNTEVEFEQKQDISYQDFVIQVKHKETQNYYNSTIRKPVIQLIDLFEKNQSQKFCLYCHFKNKEPETWNLTLEEFNKILGDKKNEYDEELKEKFINNFYIEFSEDFESQFMNLINLIKFLFKFNDDEAYLYHSIFRSKLLDLSIKLKSQRKIKKSDLDNFINDTEKTIFYTGYAKYLGKEKYEKCIKKEYFTFKEPNINNFERLFIIDCDKEVGITDLNKIVYKLSKKYFRVGKSPQPFLCFINCENETLITLKNNLIDAEFMFNDGTCFDGSKFRLDKLIEKELGNKKISIKFIREKDIVKLLVSNLKIQEIFQFYLEKPLNLETEYNHIKIQIEDTKQILKMI